MGWLLGLGVFLLAAVGVGGWAGYRFASEKLAEWNRTASSAPPATAPPPTTAAAQPPLRPPTPEPVPTALPATPPPATTLRAATAAAASTRPTPPPSARPVESTPPPPRVTQPAPPPTTQPRAPEPTLAPAQFAPADARRSAEDAYKDLWSALLKGDAATAKKYVPTSKLRTMRSERAVIADFMGLPVSQIQVGKTQTVGNKAVIFAKGTAASITDERGRPSPVEVVVRMYREDGYWKVLSQMWLLSTSPDRERQEATGWLKSAPAAGDEHLAAVARLEGMGARFDADGFRSAVTRGDVEQVRLFLQAGMSVRAPLRSGGSALDLALTGLQGDPAQQDMVIALIRAGADLEERTPAGATPIMRAVAACRPRVVDALVTARARLDAKDNDGRTVLDWARKSCPSIEGPLKASGAR
jgi:hypothetical protein